ncbi:hypothetical protein IQ276_005115 [Desmonostoc muscorum LEGE 12446]|uniref:Uncharacterized protein n=1 Tax=Desmonostoc muscorum LEGE 12446 TaxID=1828758 RepID=A0A8J6ZLU5_DESMC|nr:hypothetical protein [Desmonostoc muscorum]MCF2145850.1 hypothetical protein [Desmonostoc muscorum LEGE 12446]
MRSRKACRQTSHFPINPNKCDRILRKIIKMRSHSPSTTNAWCGYLSSGQISFRKSGRVAK